MREPKYDPPAHALVEEGIELASRYASFRKPRLVALDTKRIVPREMIVLESDLTELMDEAPGSVPPIVVAPWGDVHVVVDGHHRLAGLIQAGHKSIWAIEADLVKLKHLVGPGWY